MKQGRDWKHIILLTLNALTLVAVVATLLMYTTPVYRNAVARDVGVLAYRQCQLDTAQVVVNDLNTRGFTQLTLGNQVVKLGRVE